MKWSSLKKLLSGLVGNSIFLVSIISIVSMVPYVEIGNQNISLSIVGATILLIAYVSHKVLIPDTIDNFKDYREMYEHIKGVNTDNKINLSLEFSMLEKDKEINNLPVFSDLEYKLHSFKTCDEYKKLIGDDSVLYPLTIIKYCLIDHSKKYSRVALTIAFFVGSALFYFPAASRVVTVAIEGF